MFYWSLRDGGRYKELQDVQIFFGSAFFKGFFAPTLSLMRVPLMWFSSGCGLNQRVVFHRTPRLQESLR